ncbi:hypothetical protein [Paenibacillus solani]|uniref:hypothetical protein n=1 Tax=Paenibacillus solani TaxID=1705565 RepID=UPI003D2AFBCA
MKLFSQGNISYLEVKWCLNHIVWNLAYNHFIDWMKIAKESAHLKTRPKTKYDDIFSEDSICLFLNKENGLELYNVQRESWYYDLSCPHKNKKKISSEEISHLPMRLALTKR